MLFWKQMRDAKLRSELSEQICRRKRLNLEPRFQPIEFVRAQIQIWIWGLESDITVNLERNMEFDF